jgi:kynureninase
MNRILDGVHSLSFARAQDSSDPLAKYRGQFLIPRAPDGGDSVYLAGNSLGLQPANAQLYIRQELEDWARFGVEGHWNARHPWLPYHENLTAMMARIVGAQAQEVVMMNTLTVNLHLMMVSFYRPTPDRYKILVESDCFPSDRYAVSSQAAFHGFDPQQAVLELKPRDGEALLDLDDILAYIDEHGHEVALVLLGNVNYLTGQAFDMKAIARAAHAKGACVGFDLAHGAGNLTCDLHDSDVDFAVWCGYKYLNGGPGTLAGCFVHERHAHNNSLPRFAGWWGHNKQTRFLMGPQFDALSGAEGWQLSNPPIFQLAALRASLELFEAAGMYAIRQKGDRLTAYMQSLLEAIPGGFCKVVTPQAVGTRGAQLSVRVKTNPKELVDALGKQGVICDFRQPDIIRAAPVPLYNSFEDVFRFAEMVKRYAAAGC